MNVSTHYCYGNRVHDQDGDSVLKPRSIIYVAHLQEENTTLCWSFAKGTTAKAHGTTAIAVDSVG